MASSGLATGPVAWKATVPAAVLGAGLGAAVLASPMGALTWVAMALAMLAVVQVVGVARAWRGACVGMLAGYIVLGRGFAYLGVTVGGLPLYVGELLLIASLGAISHRGVLGPFLATAPARWFALFAILGVVRTVPGMAEHGADAVRDAAIYYYGAYLYLGYAFLGRTREHGRLLGRALGVAFVLHLAYTLLYMTGTIASPDDDVVGLLSYRDDVGAVNAMGAVLFSVLLAPRLAWAAWARWPLMLAELALFLGLKVRAAYVAATLVAAILLYAGRLRRLLLGLAIVSAAVLLLSLMPAELSPLGDWTPARLVEEITSTVDLSGAASYRYADSELSSANNQWRLEYWNLLIERSLQSWWSVLLGQGFGHLLAVEDRFTAGTDRPNRNPHNVALTVFARVGLVGLTLWTAFHLAMAWRFLVALRGGAGRAGGFTRDALTFLGGYAACLLGAALFGVVLEAPFGAIPYYFLLGVALRWTGRVAAPRRSEPACPPAPRAAWVPSRRSRAAGRPRGPCGCCRCTTTTSTSGARDRWSPRSAGCSKRAATRSSSTSGTTARSTGSAGPGGPGWRSRRPGTPGRAGSSAGC
jgi:hypothetical protein